MPGAILGRALAGLIIVGLFLIIVFGPMKVVDWLRDLKPQDRSTWIFVIIIAVTLIGISVAAFIAG